MCVWGCDVHVTLSSSNLLTMILSLNLISLRLIYTTLRQAANFFSICKLLIVAVTVISYEYILRIYLEKSIGNKSKKKKQKQKNIGAFWTHACSELFEMEQILMIFVCKSTIWSNKAFLQINSVDINKIKSTSVSENGIVDKF